MQATLETTAKNVDTYIDQVLVPTPTPWFLKSEDLYLLAKKALSDMKLGDYSVVKKAITIVDKSTEMLVGKFTSYTIEEGFSVLKVIDETLATYCPKADEAIDTTHSRFLEALTGLKAATKTQIEAIYSKLGVEEAKTYAVTMATGAYEIAKGKAPAAVETVEKLLIKAGEAKVATTEFFTSTYNAANDKFVATKEATTVFATNTYNAANEKLVATKDATIEFAVATKDATIEFANAKVEQVKGVGAHVINSAEPYGKVALDVSKPYVMKAVDISTPVVTPLVVSAAPYVTPYVEYAKKTMKGNETVAPLYKSVEKIVGDVKEFYTTEKTAAHPIAVE